MKHPPGSRHDHISCSSFSPAQTGRTRSGKVACLPTLVFSTHRLRWEQGEQAAQHAEAKGAKYQAASNVHPAEEFLANEPASNQRHTRQEQPPHDSGQQKPREKDSHAERL